MSNSKRNNFIKKFYKKLQSKNQFQAFLCFQRVEHNLSWKIKFFKTPTYIRYVIAKLSKLVQISMLVSPDSFLQRFSLKIQKKGMKLVSKPIFYGIFYIYIFFKCYINWPNVITRLCLVPSSSVRCVLCFMLGHLMMS